MSSGRNGSRRRTFVDQDGFTLLELLIAISILGLVFAAAAGGLRFSTEAWRVSARHLAESDDRQIAHRILRRQLGAALNAPGANASQPEAGSFEGRRDHVSFVAPAPALAMGPGLFRLAFGVVPDGAYRALSLSWRRVLDQPREDASANTEPVLRRVRDVRFSYFGDPDGSDRARWRDEWRDTTSLPRLVRIQIQPADHADFHWPPIVVAVGARSD